jgi:hypothetical protein
MLFRFMPVFQKNKLVYPVEDTRAYEIRDYGFRRIPELVAD